MKYKNRYLPFTGRRARILQQMLENAKAPDHTLLKKQADEARATIAAYVAKKEVYTYDKTDDEI